MTPLNAEMWHRGENLSPRFVCEAMASLIHTHLGSIFLDPEDIKNLIMGAICNSSKGTELLLQLSIRLVGIEDLF
jgi:hypothetical protein